MCNQGAAVASRLAHSFRRRSFIRERFSAQHRSRRPGRPHTLFSERARARADGPPRAVPAVRQFRRPAGGGRVHRRRSAAPPPGTIPKCGRGRMGRREGGPRDGSGRVFRASVWRALIWHHQFRHHGGGSVPRLWQPPARRPLLWRASKGRPERAASQHARGRKRGAAKNRRENSCLDVVSKERYMRDRPIHSIGAGGIPDCVLFWSRMVGPPAVRPSISAISGSRPLLIPNPTGSYSPLHPNNPSLSRALSFAVMDSSEKIKSRWTRSFFTAVNRRTDEEKYICDICQKDLNSPSNLALHQNTHVIERPFKCEPCQVSFVTQG